MHEFLRFAVDHHLNTGISPSPTLDMINYKFLTYINMCQLLLPFYSSDNGPKYSSQALEDFAKWYGFQHTTSSLHYSRGNGLAERTVRTI